MNAIPEIVGPRPTVPSQVSRYTPWQRRRLEVKPGMAGWAWIHERNNLPWADRIELDRWKGEDGRGEKKGKQRDGEKGRLCALFL